MSAPSSSPFSKPNPNPALPNARWWDPSLAWLSVKPYPTSSAALGPRAEPGIGARFTPGSALSVTLLLSPRAAWVPEYYPVTAQRRREDGSVEVDLEANSATWVMRLLLRLAPDVTVLAPASLAAEHTARLRAALGSYCSDPPA